MPSCPPNYDGANPCANDDPSLIREMGLPGAVGLPGSTPVFVVGTVFSGPAPSVTFTAVNPLLYRVDFIIPSTNIHDAQTWTATQTFADVIVDGTFTTNGGATIDVLTVTGIAAFNDLVTFGGAVTFSSSLTAVSGITANAITVSGTTTLNSTVLIPNIPQLGAAVAILGTVVVLPDGTLNYSPSSSGANTASNTSALSAVIPYNQAETAIAFTLPLVIPSGASAIMNLSAVLKFSVSGANPPSDVSYFFMSCRLDDPVTGTVLGTSNFTNFEASGTVLSLTTVPAGPHTLYFTISGASVGTSSIVLAGITAIANF